MQPLNIQIFVDVVQLLLDEDASRAVFMFDDSAAYGEGQGTSGLRSPIWPGQLVRWSLNPIDVQTPIWIARIEFGDEPIAAPAPCPPPVWARSWSGFVPAWSLAPGREYSYRLVLSTGGAREIAVEGPALVFPAIAPPVAEETSEPELAA